MLFQNLQVSLKYDKKFSDKISYTTSKHIFHFEQLCFLKSCRLLDNVENYGTAQRTLSSHFKPTLENLCHA